MPAVTEPCLTGGCLCGGVRFELTEPAPAAGYCHCTRCQRRTGTAASAQARIDGRTFRLRERLTDAGVRGQLIDSAPANGGGRLGKQVGEAFVEFQAGVAQFARREIVLRDLERGLVDFPAIRDEREVYLCWIEGEPDIAFWHELDAGYAGRREL